MEKVNCLILNTVEDDYQTVWEIVSVVKSKYLTETKDCILGLVYESLRFLILHRLVSIYNGYNFLGEEQEIKDFEVTKEFILMHMDDWEKLDYKGIDYRFYITPSGKAALIKECLPEYFK
ncbi:hypothetical protein ACDQ55_21265 [Chitinophaga sp. 30R24]|uniref:hypothetical protein n=1 Tax=Chitinophaga sp. 30R24 TaxID=3248838 RepID=UPI003B8F85D7